MKLVTGGIGVSHVSISSGITLYVNKEFADNFSGDRALGLAKVVRSGDGWLLHLSPSVSRQQPYASAGSWLWRARFSKGVCPYEGFPVGGKTPILSLSHRDGGGLIVGIPKQLIPSTRTGPRSRKRNPAVPTEVEPPVEAPHMRRSALVREINAWKDEMGDALDLSITPEGKLRALVEYG